MIIFLPISWLKHILLERTVDIIQQVLNNIKVTRIGFEATSVKTFAQLCGVSGKEKGSNVKIRELFEHDIVNIFLPIS